MTLPLLYKLTKTSAIQTYLVTTTDNIITVTQGQVDGLKQSYPTTCIAKNLGRSNATTATQQAQLEAKSKWASKIKAGYSEDPSGTLTTQLPMKVKKYQDQLKNIKFPCRVMTKFNGINSIHRSTSIFKRGGEQFPDIPHLDSDRAEIMSILNTTTLGGELYIHGQHLQDIQSAVTKSKELSKQLVLHVFALPDSGKTFGEVCDTLNKCPSTTYVKPCRSIIANNHEEIKAFYNKALSLNYEGIVIYNESGTYQYNVRSSNVFKFKPVQDGEYKILNYVVDKSGHPTLICETTTSTFKVKPKGTSDERKQIIIDFSAKYHNQFYKVEYEMLSKSGTPLKPVGIGLRQCTITGKPLI